MFTITFRNFRYFDEQGNDLSGITQAQSFASATKIASIEFESVPYFFGGNATGNQIPGFGPSTYSGNLSNDPNASAQFTPEYTWVIFGGSEATANTTAVDEFDDAFSFSATDAATVAIWGELPDGENIESSTIPNGTVGQAAINAILFENVRKIFKCGFETPYVNPWITPNSIHGVTHYRSAQTNVLWLLEKVSMRLDKSKKFTQNFEFYRGLLS